LLVGGIGEIPIRLVTLLVAASSGIFLMLIGSELGDRRAGIIAGLMFLFTPLLANTGRTVSAEPLLVLLSLAGVWLMIVALRTGRRRTGFAAGALFGLAFLTKLWLVAIPMAGIAGGLLFFRLSTKKRQMIPVIVYALTGFLLFGSLQLLLCLLFSPDTFRHWLGIYTGFSLADRVAGAGFADYWHRPWNYYLLLIGRAFGQWLPLVPLGFITALRKRRESPAAAVTIAWLIPLILMSMISVKSGNYILPLMPALFLLAGFGASALIHSAGVPSITRRDALLAAMAGMLLCLAVQLEFGSGVIPGIYSKNVLRIQIVMAAAVLMPAFAPRVSRRAAGVYVTAAILIAMAGGLARDIQIVRSRNHVTGYRKAAAALARGLEDIDPRQLCFISPEWPAVSFYTFRTGRYWESPYVNADPEEAINSLEGAPFFYVIQYDDLLYGGVPDEDVLEVIEREAFPFEPGDGRIRIYVNEALRERLPDGIVP
jgi:4-amino-4-deoxy-L-arabinose transferase-like glycosyltransferase